MSGQVVSLDLATEAAKEEAANEALTDEAFVPTAPLTKQPVAWTNGATFAKGALATEGTQIYRSLEDGNKEHKPSEDADFVHWTPVNVAIVPLQNPAFGGTSFVK